MSLLRKVSMSKIGEEFIEEGFRRQTELPGMTYLMPEVKELFSQYFEESDDKFSRLLIRTAIDVGATKRMLMHLYVVAGYSTAQEVDDIEGVAWKRSHKNLYKPLKALEEFEASLQNRDRKQPL